MIWSICFVLAGVIFVASIACAFISWITQNWSSRTRFYLLSVGAFLVTFVLLIPYFLEEEIPEISKILMALHSAAQAFTFDISALEFVKDITSHEPSGLFFEWYGRSLSIIIMICPLFTLGFVLSLFKNFWPMVRFSFRFRKPAYIFSNLNNMTLAFANSIAEEKRGLIVFANAYAKEETEPELLEDAKSIHAICFSKSVDHLPVRKAKHNWARKVMFLMIGEDGSVELSQALELSKKYCERPNTRVFLYSSSSIAGKVIDSARSSSPSLSSALVNQIVVNYDCIWDPKIWEENNSDQYSGFFMRRIDPIKTLAQETLSEDSLVEYLKNTANNNTISIMIVGLGSLGKQLLKTAAWLYQINDYSVEINAFDQRSDMEIRQILEQECPELLDKTIGSREGDASYDIEIYSELDCFSSSFGNVIRTGSFAERLQRTQAIFVTLGDDDQNIEAAVQLRVLFDQIAFERWGEKQPDSPQIYSVVYDDEKLANLNLHATKKEVEAPSERRSGKKTKPTKGVSSSLAQTGAHVRPSGIRTHKEDPYGIHFVGNLSAQYNINMLETIIRRQREAMSRHLSWMVVNHYVKEAFEDGKHPKFRAKLIELYKEIDKQESEISIYDPFEIERKPISEAEPNIEQFNKIKECAKKNKNSIDCEKSCIIKGGFLFGAVAQDKQVDENAVVILVNEDSTLEPKLFGDYRKEAIAGLIWKGVHSYYAYEYFRDSSCATSLHKEKIAPKFGMPLENLGDRKIRLTAITDEAHERRITEHKRWNAYMRSIGYRFGKKRLDRGLLHYDLVPFNELDPVERFKD